MTTLELMQSAKAAAPLLATADSAQKNTALLTMAEAIWRHTEDRSGSRRTPRIWLPPRERSPT